MFNKFPKRTGIYHIKDNIEHLELRLYFRHINSLLKLPKFDYNKIVNGEWHTRKQLYYNNTADEDEVQIVDIKWQEKLFSISEEELYKEAKNCITETQQKYHEWLLAKEEAEINSREQEEQEKSNNKRKHKKRTKKQQKFDNKSNDIKKTYYKIYTYVHDDNFEPDKKPTKFKTETVVHFYIYAAIDIDTQLVHLQWFPNERILQIYPDFNSMEYNPYFIEIDKDYRHLYAYAIENISRARSTPSASNLNMYLQLPDYAQIPHWRTEAERSKLFSMPPKRTRRVSLLLELRDAFDFQYNGLHIRYHIELPPNTIHEEGLLEASTHSSCISESGIHHFGYNWELTLLCEENYISSNLLHIYLEVISIDSWERERVEGYAHLAICLVNACTIKLYRLQCLRPVITFWASIERYFIGGRRKFDFKRFFGQQQRQQLQLQQQQKKHEAIVDDSDDDDNNNDDDDDVDDNNDDDDNKNEADISMGFHSRYGCRMENTGCLTISCQRFTQKNFELLGSSTKQRRIGMTLEDVMCAYREARKRLETVTLK